VEPRADDDRQRWAERLFGVRQVIDREDSREEILLALCRFLRKEIGHYDWVGFYLVEGAPEMLRLGPYDGAPTRHVEIPFGQGVCGLAAEKRRALMVPDVSRVVNYLSCSPRVQSEFVVPIFADGEMVAELDVDSHTLDAFGEQDKEFLEAVVEAVAELFKKN